MISLWPGQFPVNYRMEFVYLLAGKFVGARRASLGARDAQFLFTINISKSLLKSFLCYAQREIASNSLQRDKFLIDLQRKLLKEMIFLSLSPLAGNITRPSSHFVE